MKKQSEFISFPAWRNLALFTICFFSMVVLSQPSWAQQHAGVVSSTIPVSAISTGGPGTEMTKMINRLGLGSDCGRCKALAAQMDANGSQWVQNNFDSIAKQTISNAENLGNRMGPVRRTGVRVLIRRAIRRSN